MIEFIVVCVIIHAGLLRIWFDSKLFSGARELAEYCAQSHGVLGWVGQIVTCWQCFGVWLGWFVVYITSCCLPDTPVSGDNAIMVFLLGPAVGLISEILDYKVLSELRI